MIGWTVLDFDAASCSDFGGAHGCVADGAAGGTTVDCRLLDKVLAIELLLSPSPPGGAIDWRRL